MAGRMVAYKYSGLPRQIISKLTKEFRSIEEAPQSRTLTYTACLTRNPVDRLVSAWKSKLACGQANGQHHAESAKEKFGTDVADTRWLLPALLRGAARHYLKKLFY